MKIGRCAKTSAYLFTILCSLFSIRVEGAKLCIAANTMTFNSDGFAVGYNCDNANHSNLLDGCQSVSLLAECRQSDLNACVSGQYYDTPPAIGGASANRSILCRNTIKKQWYCVNGADTQYASGIGHFGISSLGIAGAIGKLF